MKLQRLLRSAALGALALTASPAHADSALDLLRMATGLYTPEPRAIPETPVNTGDPEALGRRGYALLEAGRISEAVKHFDRAHTQVLARVGADHPDVGRALARRALARSQDPSGNSDQEALRLYTEAVDNLSAALGPLSEALAYVRFDMSRIYARRGAQDAAKRLVHQALLAITRQAKPRAAALYRMYLHLADLLQGAGEYGEARRALRLAADAAGRCLKADQMLCVGLSAELGGFDALLGDLERAEGQYIEALTTLETLPTADPRRARPLDQLGRLWLSRGTVERAEALLLEREGLYNPESGRRRSANPALADARRTRGDLSGALEIYSRAIQQRTQRSGWGAPGLIEAYCGQALTFISLERKDEALNAAARALSVAEIRPWPALRWRARATMARALASAGHMEGAVLFGKLALHTLWGASKTTLSLGPEIQLRFLQARERLFTALIEDMMRLDLLGEAQGLSGTWSSIQEGHSPGPPPPLTPDEQATQARYHKLLQGLAQSVLALDPPSPERRPWSWSTEERARLVTARQAQSSFTAGVLGLLPSVPRKSPETAGP